MSGKETLARVSIVEFKGVDVSLAKALALIGFPKSLPVRDKSVLIKPNLTAAAPASSGCTTHVHLVEALIRSLQKQHPRCITIGESAGAEIDTEIAFTNLGYSELAEQAGIKLIDFDRYPFKKVRAKNGLYRGTIEISQALWDFDIYISIPCLKPHLGCGISVAYKNAFGVISDTSKITIHREDALEEALVDINAARSPDLVIVDGIIGAEGIAGGTDFSHPVNSKLILCGTDALAVDVISTHIMKQNPNICYIKWAADRNMGISQLDRIEVRGLPLDRVSHKFMSPLEQLEHDFHNLEVVDGDACTRCRETIGMTFLRLGPHSLRKNVTIVCGNKLTHVEESNPVILLGNCACSSNLTGIRIEGCPGTENDLMEAFSKNDILCEKCRKSIEDILSEFDQQEVMNISVVAEGQVIYRGKKDRRRLFVGDCTQRYYTMDRNRSEKSARFGTGFNRISEYVSGCPPDREGIIRGLSYLIKKQ
jgi:uncharacterized protein (DUF362 family)